MPPMSLIPVVNLPTVSLIPVVHLELRNLHKFAKKFETVLMGYSGAGGKLIYDKTRSKKSLDTVPLKVLSSHLNWGARLDSFDLLLKSRCPASLEIFF